LPASPLKIIVGMPAYNEEKYLGSLVLRARRHADEIIVVDDGSGDRSAAVAELAGATVIRHGANLGYGRAIRGLLKAAGERDADILVILDADAQHDPDEIPALVEAVRGGADVAIGSRQAERHHIPAYRRFGQRVLGSFTRIASRSDVIDTESGFRAYSRKALEELRLKEEGMAVSAEIVTVAAAQGLQIVEVPITVTYSGDSSTLHPVAHGVGVLRRVLEMISERRPLLSFGIIGGLLIIAGIIAGIIVIQMLRDIQVMQAGTAIMSMLLINLGAFSWVTGIILDVLLRRAGGSPQNAAARRDSGRLISFITEHHPLTVFGTAGVVAIAAAIAIGITVVRTLAEVQILQVGSALLAATAITVGILSIATGLILRTLTGRG